MVVRVGRVRLEEGRLGSRQAITANRARLVNDLAALDRRSRLGLVDRRLQLVRPSALAAPSGSLGVTLVIALLFSNDSSLMLKRSCSLIGLLLGCG